MNLNLSGKTAVVCGSTAGIGRAIAFELAGLGAEIVAVARNEAKLAELIAELPGNGHSFLQADFADQNQVRRALEKFAAGGKTAHILVNNTGGPPGGPVFDAEPEQFLSAFNNHLIVNHLLVKNLVPGMKKAGFGRIVNIVSTSVREPLQNLGVSNTTRGAVASWAKTLANELGAFGITVNNVLPGATRTGRLASIIEAKAEKSGISVAQAEAQMLAPIPAGRFAEPEEIAALAAFLCSPAAGYINGTSIAADGGRTKCI